jgi:hypothetical protein
MLRRSAPGTRRASAWLALCLSIWALSGALAATPAPPSSPAAPGARSRPVRSEATNNAVQSRAGATPTPAQKRPATAPAPTRPAPKPGQNAPAAKPKAVAPTVLAPGPVTAPAGVKIVVFDLQGRKGPLPVAQYRELQALLTSLNADILVFQTVLRSEGGQAGTQLAVMANSLQMYYAFQPLTDTLGSALFTRYDIQGEACVADDSGGAMGMSMTLQGGGHSYSLMVVRPPTPAVGRAAAKTVAAAVKKQPALPYLVLASFSPGGGAGAVQSWLKAGLADPGARLKRAAFTFPGAKPAQRLDYALVGKPLRGDVLSIRVLGEPSFQALSEHRPVELVLRR